MAYIARADGEHFVIPSYRDVLAIKQKSHLKRDIVALSATYGDYIAMQKKSLLQYEVAFSFESGYLLGETVWHHFNRPLDLIYCEAIPNTNEALLVIVKAGSVYLDGSYAIDSIPEELVIFLTQQNSFEIFIFGDVPISPTPETGKFSFEGTAVKSFNVLDKSAFAELPLLKTYQLQLVDIVLKAQRIGTIPVRKMVLPLAALMAFLIALGWYMTYKPAPKLAPPVNPYAKFYHSLETPSPMAVINAINAVINETYQLPGWTVQRASYATGSIVLHTTSNGGSVHDLNDWAQIRHYDFSINRSGFDLTKNINLNPRAMPSYIFATKDIISTLLDRMTMIYPGNNFILGDTTVNGLYNETQIEITLNNVLPVQLGLIAKGLEGLPLVLKAMTVSIASSTQVYGGKITLTIIGN